MGIIFSFALGILFILILAFIALILFFSFDEAYLGGVMSGMLKERLLMMFKKSKVENGDVSEKGE